MQTAVHLLVLVIYQQPPQSAFQSGQLDMTDTTPALFELKSHKASPTPYNGIKAMVTRQW